MKKYFIICSLSLLLSLYLFEGYLKFFSSDFDLNRKVKIYEKNSSNKYDKRTKVQIYKDLKKIFDDVSVTVPPKTYVMHPEKDIFPLSGLANSKTIHCNENGYYSIFQSDRYGFNNPDTEWDAEEIEYLLIGDSYALGACVNRPNDIASILRKLSKKNVLTLGYDGNGPLKEYAVLREYLKINVKNVIWIYTESNDLDNLNDELGSKILVNYSKDKLFSQKLITKQKIIDNYGLIKIDEEEELYNKKIIKNFLKLYHTRGVLNMTLPDKLQPKNKIYEYKLNTDFKKVLSLAKNLVLKNNSNFYFVYIPNFKTPKSEHLYKKTKNMMKILDIEVIDIFKEVHQKEENISKLFPLNISGHYNEYGYQKIAKTINSKISK